MENIECDHCGGTDFYKEAGYYFCSVCQVQSQEVQEYVYDEYAGGGEHHAKHKSRKMQSDKINKTENKITSWECYNYILLGLTDELINLGADRRLKPIVRILWLRYLEKLEVFKRGSDAIPRLQGLNCDRDADIVYGRQKPKKKRKRMSSSSEMDSSTLDSSSMKRERTRRKKALVKAQYDEFSQKSQGTSSLHNETLTSLQTGSEGSSLNVIPISYNKHITKEMTKTKCSSYHWRKHRHDFERKLKCHKLVYGKVSSKFKISAYVLSLNKLYAILYLALLIVRDRIQLCDMLRFIQEGHLSFNYYSHFLPDEFADKVLNFRNFKKNCLFGNYAFRATAAKVAVFLQIEQYIAVPNLVELCQRYCKELNLPKEVCECVVKLMSFSRLKMRFYRGDSRIPNYEGRVLCFIIFVIKLLFGLDDVTEFKLAKYTKILNENSHETPKFFNMEEWLKHIEYRGFVMKKSYFSSTEEVDDVKLPLRLLRTRQFDSSVKPNSKKDNFKQVLEKLQELLPEPDFIEFPVSLTPFVDNVKLISNAKYLEILQFNFTGQSLDHILKPVPFMTVINGGELPQIINGGANKDWILERLFCCKLQSLQQVKESRKLITVELTLEDTEETQGESPQETLNNSDVYKDNFQLLNEKSFSKNAKKLEKHSDVCTDTLKGAVGGRYPLHYNPYERFWVRTRIRTETLAKEECQKYVEEFPYSFQVVFKEGARIAQQVEQEFLEEYQLTELFLTYWVPYKKNGEKKEAKQRLIRNFLQRNAKFW